MEEAGWDEWPEWDAGEIIGGKSELETLETWHAVEEFVEVICGHVVPVYREVFDH